LMFSTTPERAMEVGTARSAFSFYDVTKP